MWKINKQRESISAQKMSHDFLVLFSVSSLTFAVLSELSLGSASTWLKLSQTDVLENVQSLLTSVDMALMSKT